MMHLIGRYNSFNNYTDKRQNESKNPIIIVVIFTYSGISIIK